MLLICIFSQNGSGVLTAAENFGNATTNATANDTGNVAGNAVYIHLQQRIFMLEKENIALTIELNTTK
jgi:hypothetical protein